MRGRIVGVLVVCVGATVCLAGMEVSAIASLEHIGKQSWLGAVFFAMCAASIVGGLVYGGVKKVPSVLVLLVLMAALEIPVGLGDGNVLLLCLLLVPMNLMCAPLIAASGEHISKLAPPTARGLALGLQGSAFTVGSAIGAPDRRRRDRRQGSCGGVRDRRRDRAAGRGRRLAARPAEQTGCHRGDDVLVNLAPFKSVLALPGVRPLMLLMLFARIPPTAAGVTVTLHVVTTLDKGYAAAGTVGFATMIGLGLGSPLMGKLVDSKGLRFVLALSVLEGAFWLSAPFMDYYVLLVLAFANGLVAVPVMSIGRQALTAIVPEPQRRPAFSLDSISVELSFMVGPAAGVLIATKFSTGTALVVIGLAILTASAVLFVVNPVLLHEDDVIEGSPPRSCGSGCAGR